MQRKPVVNVFNKLCEKYQTTGIDDILKITIDITGVSVTDIINALQKWKTCAKFVGLNMR